MNSILPHFDLIDIKNRSQDELAWFVVYQGDYGLKAKQAESTEEVDSNIYEVVGTATTAHFYCGSHAEWEQYVANQVEQRLSA